ncbi:hypothetical protein MPH_03686 [Macrophomina phaseolina MS6]|uniref:Uncharacterized protein n=1 Tax=Macrophomina phaseolina (strain MS6) TaxID=1126212 RepID=K2R952_MACPH|nr:hypothetical protein MPH_03686 [Macrophomina phaseolina MS6]
MWPMGTYQGILLSIIFATMTRSRLAPQQLSESEYEVLVGLIKSCKRRGMFQYPRMHAQYDRAGVDHNTVIYIWVGIEEAKRFALAVYHVWKMCKDRALGHHGDDDLLTVADLEFPIPMGEHMWLSESKELFLQRVTETIDAENSPCNHGAEWICNGKGV